MPSRKTCSGESIWGPGFRVWWTPETRQKPGPPRGGGTGRAGARDQAADDRGELVGLDRLGDVGIEPGRHDLDPLVDAAVGGDRDGGDTLAVRDLAPTPLADEGVAALLGHLDVGDDHVGLPRSEQVDCLP